MDVQNSNDGRLTPPEERRLIEGAQRGCERSARSLVEAYQHRLHAFVWRMVRNKDDAEEICQDTFLRAFQALDGFDFSYRFSTWLFTIGYRLCLNSLRRKKDYTGDVDFNIMAIRPPADTPDNVSDAVANSHEAVRLKKVIWDAVEKLTPAQTATVLLFYRESLSCQEIGEILDMPAATVKSHLHRARNRLKGMLDSELVDDWAVVRFGDVGAA